ncbi:MAG: hypothetical protein JWM98_2799 [Thermoleophilia bacterium]|nr:hypothetical protein [Thermoleophilia bacterium]
MSSGSTATVPGGSATSAQRSEAIDEEVTRQDATRRRVRAQQVDVGREVVGGAFVGGLIGTFLGGALAWSGAGKSPTFRAAQGVGIALGFAGFVAASAGVAALANRN